MIKLNNFNNLNNDIEIGDWVVLKKYDSCSILYNYFLDVSCNIMDVTNFNIKLRYKYKDFWCSKEDIEYNSKNKKDVEAFIQAKKYNL